MNKFFRGLLVMGAAAVVTVGSSLVQVKAAPMAPTTITVHYDTQNLGIAKENKKKIYVASTTVTTRNVRQPDKTMKPVTTVKAAAPVVYDAQATTTVELSSFAVTKDNYISIWGDKNPEPILVKIPAVKTKIKAVVSAADNSVTIQDTTNPKAPVNLTDSLEYCTMNGKWTDMTNGATFDSFSKLGATLRIRIKATAQKALAAADKVVVGTDAEGNAVEAYAAPGTFAGNELKAKIAKTAAGPKATIDYNLRTIKMPVTAEYRLTGASANALAAYTSVEGDTLANGKKAATATLQVDNLLKSVTAGDFDIRTKATDKKAASQITEYHLYAVLPITTVASNGKAPVTSGNITDVSEAVVGSPVNASGYANPQVQCTKVTLNSRTMKGTVTLQNNTTDKYQIVVVPAASGATTPAANAKVKATLNLTKEGAARPSVVNVAVASGDFIYIRKMGDAKLTSWSSPYVFLGRVMNTFPATN